MNIQKRILAINKNIHRLYRKKEKKMGKSGSRN